LFTPCLKRQEARFFAQGLSLNRIPENLSGYHLARAGRLVRAKPSLDAHALYQIGPLLTDVFPKEQHPREYGGAVGWWVVVGGH
jgi:hypothetical protein